MSFTAAVTIVFSFADAVPLALARMFAGVSP